MKQAIWIACISVLILGSCTGARPQTIRSFAELKSIRKDSKLFDSLAGRDIVVEGYFVKDPLPILVKDLKWARINTPMPDSVYLTIGGPALEIINKDLDRYQGSYIRLKCRINPKGQNLTADSTLGKPTRFEADLVCPEPPEVIRPKDKAFIIPQKFNLCRLNPKFCLRPLFVTKNYALLYSGGYDAANAHSRYWNDLKFMYNTLKSDYGYTDDQIVVVYKDGTPEDADMTVDFPASPTGLNNAFAYLGARLNRLSELFFFATNHGGGYNISEAANRGGIPDAMPLDEIDRYHYDETTYFYNQASNDITDDTVAVKINALHFRKLIAVLEPCFSGGFLRDLRGTNRTIISAATEFEYSWAGAPDNHDMFSYYFTCALNKATHTGAPVNADTNGDGKISMLEAFLYAKSQDTASESPQLEDTGDGVGTNSPAATAGSDGYFSNSTYLN